MPSPSANVERLLARWAAAAEMSVYLHDDVTPEARAAVEQMLRESELVSDHELCPRQRRCPVSGGISPIWLVSPHR